MKRTFNSVSFKFNFHVDAIIAEWDECDSATVAKEKRNTHAEFAEVQTAERHNVMELIQMPLKVWHGGVNEKPV